nr:hypothetical protein Itr_chr13CG12040 [Ipomoea trifida]
MAAQAHLSAASHETSQAHKPSTFRIDIACGAFPVQGLGIVGGAKGKKAEVLGDCWIDFGILKEVGTWEWGWGVVHCGGYRRKKRAAEWWADWRRGRSLSVLLQLPSIKASEATSDVARSLEAVLLRRDHCEKMRLRPEEIFFAAVRCRY